MIIDTQSGHKPGCEAPSTERLKTNLNTNESATRYISAVPLKCPSALNNRYESVMHQELTVVVELK